MHRARCLLCFGVALSLSAGTSAQQATDTVRSTGVSSAPSAAADLPADTGDLTVPGIGAVVKEMPRDLWRFLSVDTALVLGAGGAAAGIAHIWDDDLAGQVETSVRLNDALAPGNTYGSFAVQASIGVGMYGFGRVFGSSPVAIAGADIMRAQLVSQLWVQALKFSVQRTRPDRSNDLSFPSGHSASSFATAAVLQHHFGWKAGIPAYVVAGYVATARVHDNKHYLSDVVFGGAMGIAGERTVMRAGRYTVRVAPAAGSKTTSLLVIVTPRS